MEERGKRYSRKKGEREEKFIWHANNLTEIITAKYCVWWNEREIESPHPYSLVIYEFISGLIHW
jgi:hypothetical protein